MSGFTEERLIEALDAAGEPTVKDSELPEWRAQPRAKKPKTDPESTDESGSGIFTF